MLQDLRLSTCRKTLRVHLADTYNTYLQTVIYVIILIVYKRIFQRSFVKNGKLQGRIYQLYGGQ
jgi:hypothetical protein